MRIPSLAALTLFFGLATPAALAADQIGLAASGRFDELQRTLEAQAAQKPLDIPDRHALCFAYSKTKQYALLDQCLTALEQLAAGTRNRRTRLFGLDDVIRLLSIANLTSAHAHHASKVVRRARWPEVIRDLAEAVLHCSLTTARKLGNCPGHENLARLQVNAHSRKFHTAHLAHCA